MEFQIGDIFKDNETGAIFIIYGYKRYPDTFAICNEAILVEYSITKRQVKNFIKENNLTKIGNIKQINFENSDDNSGLY